MPINDCREEVTAHWRSNVVKVVFEKFERARKPEIVEDWKNIARIYPPLGMRFRGLSTSLARANDIE